MAKFDAYTAAEIELKIATYLENDPGVRRFYQLTPQALYIGDLEKEQVDYILQLNTGSPLHSKPRKCHTLENVRIAIDPGHFGGRWAQLEKRFVIVPPEKTKNNQLIYFCEGNLTYLTALELKRLLESEGALVMITRPGIGDGAMKENFFQWLENHSDLRKKESSLSRLFRSYNTEDLFERAKKINAFSPDLAVIIHYNAHSPGKDRAQTHLVRANYNLAFIPGAFGANELTHVQDRYEFLRLIVTDTLDQSLRLSNSIVKQFVTKLDVPLIAAHEKTTYSEASIIQKPGIYSRNLVLTRLIHSPLCYGETLIQNNEEEIYRLSSTPISIAGIPASRRIQEVAEAYFEGIKEYLKSQEVHLEP